MSQSEDIDVINVAILKLKSTVTAALLIAVWKVWYDDLGFFGKSLDSDVYNTARAKRDEIFKAMGMADLKALGYDALTTEQLSNTDSEFMKIPLVPGAVPPGTSVHATIKQGSKGADVTAWQKIIGVTADGNFGSGTRSATITWQQQHGLSPDGVVGPASWAAATGNKVVSPEQVATSSGFIPSSTPKTASAATPVKPATTPAIVQAGIFGNLGATLTGLSLPAKIGIGAAAVIGVAGSLKGKHHGR